jgi:transcriptional regulator with XRE-family HTH domain
MTIGDRIKEVRGKKSQDDFAQAHGIHRNTLARWESGKRSPEYSFLRDITERYGLAPDWVLMGAGPKLLAESADQEASLRAQLLDLERDKMRLQDDYIALSKENRVLIKENAELRINLTEEKARAAPERNSEGLRKASG